jgi:hypothetical protein
MSRLEPSRAARFDDVRIGVRRGCKKKAWAQEFDSADGDNRA